MVSLPEGFTATKIPGYFWNVTEQKLYSIKSGSLREMKLTEASCFTKFRNGYRVSHQGYKRWLDLEYLKPLTIEDSTILIIKKSEPVKSRYA